MLSFHICLHLTSTSHTLDDILLLVGLKQKSTDILDSQQQLSRIGLFMYCVLFKFKSAVTHWISFAMFFATKACTPCRMKNQTAEGNHFWCRGQSQSLIMQTSSFCKASDINDPATNSNLIGFGISSLSTARNPNLL
mmetsp:Transcript_17659/g.17865  ORF Transcript_17659/g.17865 Transcript_17659/m.17865 type:complete len:137 (-) Transcript_17659:38-448(-)